MSMTVTRFVSRGKPGKGLVYSGRTPAASGTPSGVHAPPFRRDPKGSVLEAEHPATPAILISLLVNIIINSPLPSQPRAAT